MITVFQSVVAQEDESASVSGIITDSKGQKLAGVNVILKGENRGTATNAQGFYQLNKIDPGQYELEIGFLGYTTQVKHIRLAKAEQLQVSVQLDEAPYEMGAVRLTGKSAIRKINEQAYAVTSVSTKELYNSTADAKQVLNRIPGVRILQDGGLGSDLDFSLNGFSGDQVKFFLNGIPMDNFGSSFNLASIPVNSIERIDVYKGVVPVWLGTDALGGAVNIITNQQNNYLDASYAIGSFNTHRASINGAYTLENGFSLRGNLNYNYADNNYDVLADIKDANGNVLKTDEVERFHDRYRSFTANVEAGWVNQSFADQLLIGIIASGDDNQLQTGSTMAIPFGAVTQESRSIIPTLKYKKKDLFADGLDVSLNAAYNTLEQKTIDTLTGIRYNWYGEALPTGSSVNGEFPNRERSFLTQDERELSTQFNTSYLFNKKHSLAFNHAYQNFKRESFDSVNLDAAANDFSSSVQKNVLGLAYQFDYNEKWSTTFFGKAYFLNVKSFNQYDFGTPEYRVGAYTKQQENFGYGIASSYFILPNLQLKASFEHTYRLPTPVELLGNGFNVISNIELQPEESDNLNIGLGYQTRIQENHRIKAEGNFVYRKADNLIYTVVEGVTNQNKNLLEGQTLGVEGSFTYRWKNIFHLGANLTYQNITDQADVVYSTFGGYQENFNKGERIPNTPYFFGNANAGLSFENVLLDDTELNLNYRFNFVEEFFFGWERFGDASAKAIIPRQFSHAIELTYSINNRYNIGVECQNLTDNRLYDKFRLQKPGRAFYVKLRYSIH